MTSGLRVLNLSMRRIASSSRMITTSAKLQCSKVLKAGHGGDMNEPLSSLSDLKGISYARVKKTPLARDPRRGFRPLKVTSCREKQPKQHRFWPNNGQWLGMVLPPGALHDVGRKERMGRIMYDVVAHYAEASLRSYPRM